MPRTNPVRNIPEEELIEVASKAEVYKEILEPFGINPIGRNIKVLSERLTSLGFNCTFFVKNAQRRIGEQLALNGVRKKIPLELILVDGSNYNNGNLKPRLLKAGLLENKCYECGLGPLWNNKPLVLQLDHINGINNDNRLINLRLLCPNCHTQTDTFGTRNLKVEKETIDKKKICHIMRRKTERPPYEQLIEEIKQLGYCAVGRKYGVTDNAIKKWVRNYRKNGY